MAELVPHLRRFQAVRARVVIVLAIVLTFVLCSLFRIAAASENQNDEDLELKAKAQDVRAYIAGEIQLQASDLLDELVYTWKSSPPLGASSRVLVVGIGVPLGLGSGLSAILENHLFTLLIANPDTKLLPVHCSSCLAVTSVSSKNETVLGRGFHFDSVMLDAVKEKAIDALLFIDFESEGPDLVLRSRLVQPTKPHQILSAFALSTQTTGVPLLRSPYQLKSRAAAEQEYLNVLKSQAYFFVPLKVLYRDFKSKTSSASLAAGSIAGTVFPMVWFEIGLEVFFTQARKWFGGVALGFTTLDQSHEGWSLAGRLGRLLFAERRSLLSPDIYAFLGGTVLSIEGNNAIAFRKDPLPASEVAAAALGRKPRASWGAFKVGVEARIKERFSVGAFLEGAPAFGSSHPNIGVYLDSGILSFQTYGLEVGLWF